MRLNGCHNRPEYRPSTLVQDGWIAVDDILIAKTTDIPFRMETLCQYTHTDLGKQDRGCDGCKWRVQ